ncbi:MAG: MFS transporter [Planctomycetes bacterium]|nr:MFS transporter [Planctomycetota bacterium]
MSDTAMAARRIVNACYQGFTLSDGALRMLVLLHLHAAGQGPWALVLVLLPYEIAGVFTNLLGGWLGARFGLKVSLLVGIALQVVACALLALDAAWLTLPLVMATQVLSSIAKDLAKTAAKSFVRQLGGDGDGGSAGLASGMFLRVAWLTGSKNAAKGLGFFVGGALLGAAGFRGTNVGLAIGLALLFGLALWLVPAGPRKPDAKLRHVVDHGPAVRWLAMARLFLFASRDTWFVVALPLFLAGSLGWAPSAVGGFLSVWVIGYGTVQALTPWFVQPVSAARGVRPTWLATASLLLPLCATAAALHAGLPPATTIVVGLCAYGVLFAITSSLHSWLVLAIAHGDDVVERVGFYYAANSAGRLLGTVLSGGVFAAYGAATDGLLACLGASALLVVAATACTFPVRRRA